MLNRLKIMIIALIAMVVGVACGGSSAPTVTIDSPPSGTSVTLGDTVEVQATATDDGDGIVRIDLLVDGSVVQASNVPGGAQGSYSAVIPWTPAVSSPVTISVVAYREDGTASEPASISIDVLNEDGSMDEPAEEVAPADSAGDDDASTEEDSSGGSTGSGSTGGGASGGSTGGDDTGGSTTDDTSTDDTNTGGTTTDDSSSDDTSSDDTQQDEPTPVADEEGSEEESEMEEESDDDSSSSNSTSTPTPTPSYTPTTQPAAQIAPEDARFNNPLAIPLDSTTSVLDFVSYPSGDAVDMVRYEVTGMNNNVAITGGRANLVISATCFGDGDEFIEFFTGGQTYSCGQTLVDREVTADSDTGTITITATGGSGTYVQWVLTGTATRVN